MTEQGRRELKKFRRLTKPPEPRTPEFDEIIDILSSGRVATTCTYHMLMSPPGSHMHDAWLGAMVKWWQARGLDEARISDLSAAFSESFSHFQNRDEFTWEFNNINHPGGPTLVQFNAKNFKPVTDAELGAGLTAHVILENGSLCLNLLASFFHDDEDDPGPLL